MQWPEGDPLLLSKIYNCAMFIYLVNQMKDYLFLTQIIVIGHFHVDIFPNTQQKMYLHYHKVPVDIDLH